jgi:hypothetical protein
MTVLLLLLLLLLLLPGVYLKSDQMPHREEDAVDFKSRHKVIGAAAADCLTAAATCQPDRQTASQSSKQASSAAAVCETSKGQP